MNARLWFAVLVAGLLSGGVRAQEGAHDAHSAHRSSEKVDAKEQAAHSHHAMHGHAAAAEPASTDHAHGHGAPLANDHVAPTSPQTTMHDMSASQMIAVMQMDDNAYFGRLRLERFERTADRPLYAWNLRADYGGDVDRIVLRSEGEREHGRSDGANAELLWSHAIAPFWDGVLGVRHDFGHGARRQWLAIGVQGLAPYWFDVDATAYLGEGGHAALRLEAAYDLRLSQRLLLEPRLEANLYGRSDRAAHVGSGLSDIEAGLRLRYELRRELAPYLGVERHWLFGTTADWARAEGEATAETRWVIGVRMGF